MKFTANRQTLLDTVTLTAQPTRSVQRLAALNGLHCHLDGNQLTVTGSNLELTVRSTVQVEDGADDGETVIPARLFSDIARQVDSDTITVACGDDGDASIAGGRTEYSIRTYTASEYPKLPDVTGERVEVDASLLRAGIEKVIKAVGTDTARPALTAVLFEGNEDVLRLVATDSYRLALCEIDAVAVLAGHAQALVPANVLQHLLPLLASGSTVGVCFSFDDQMAAFNVSSGDRDVLLTARLLEGNYPAYQGLLPESYPNVAELDRNALAQATSRVSLVGRANNTPVRVAQSAGQVELNVISQDQGQASETVDAEYTGDDLTVAFNPTYLQDGITAASAPRVRLETEDRAKPAILKPVGGDSNPEGLSNFLYLLMPVRIS